jgi:hypothetical protein
MFALIWVYGPFATLNDQGTVTVAANGSLSLAKAAGFSLVFSRGAAGCVRRSRSGSFLGEVAVWISDRFSSLPRPAVLSHPSNSCTPSSQASLLFAFDFPGGACPHLQMMPRLTLAAEDSSDATISVHLGSARVVCPCGRTVAGGISSGRLHGHYSCSSIQLV